MINPVPTGLVGLTLSPCTINPVPTGLVGLTLFLLIPRRYVIKAIIGEIERQLEAPEEESRGEGGEGGGGTTGEGEGGGEEERMEETKVV